MIVDTGSHVTAMPCDSCQQCGTHTDPYFDIKKSLTAKYTSCANYTCAQCKNNQCLIKQSYTEGSLWEAVVVDDLVWLGSFTGHDMDKLIRHFGFRFPFGCQTRETGLFITQIENGIMGLANEPSTLMAHMFREKRVEANIFSLCFAPSGGTLVLGGMDHSLHRTAVSYAPLSRSSSRWFAVRVKDILIGNTSIGVSSSEYNSGNGVIVDSGTTDTFFPGVLSDSFSSVFKRIAGVRWSNKKMQLEADQVQKLPQVVIVLGGEDGAEDVQLVVPPAKYIAEEKGALFSNIHFSERSGGVLGANVMMGYDVIFDIQGRRVGFAEANCSYGQPSPTATPSSPDNVPSHGTNAAAEGKNGHLPSRPLFFLEVASLFIVGVLAVAWIALKRSKRKQWLPLTNSDSTQECTASNTLEREAPQRQGMNSKNEERVVPLARFTIDSDDERGDDEDGSANNSKTSVAQ